MSTEHAIGALVLALLWHLEVLDKDIVLTHTAAYFLYDIFVVATHIQDFKQEVKPPLSYLALPYFTLPCLPLLP